MALGSFYSTRHAALPGPPNQRVAHIPSNAAPMFGYFYNDNCAI